MHPLIKIWQGRGLRIVVYFNDGIMAIEGLEQALAASCSIQVNLANAGFVIDTRKLQLEPVISLTWLGFNINLAQGQIQVHNSKLQALKQQKPIPAIVLASVTCKIISMSIALGPIAHFMTRSLYSSLKSRKSWCSVVPFQQKLSVSCTFGWKTKLKTI